MDTNEVPTLEGLHEEITWAVSLALTFVDRDLAALRNNMGGLSPNAFEVYAQSPVYKSLTKRRDMLLTLSRQLQAVQS